MNEKATAQGTDWRLEAWRGVAAWLVVYAHYWAFGGNDWPLLRFAFTGVDLFFVISGFIFAPYMFGQPLQLRSFALRRFFRIYPAYWLALMLYFWLKYDAGQPLEYVWQHLTFAHVQSREMAFYYNPPFWSLPAEVEFYAFLPLLAYLVHRQRRALLALAACALVGRLALGYASIPVLQNRAYILLQHLPGMGLEFALGAVSWRLSRQAMAGWRRMLLVGAGLAAWLALAFVFATLGDAAIDRSWARGQMSWLAALCFALMLTGSQASPLGAAPAAAPWLRNCALWAGRLSYGVYLFHIAALRLLEPYRAALARIPLLDLQGSAVLLTLALAWLAYVAWENPWRQAGRRWAMARP